MSRLKMFVFSRFKLLYGALILLLKTDPSGGSGEDIVQIDEQCCILLNQTLMWGVMVRLIRHAHEPKWHVTIEGHGFSKPVWCAFILASPLDAPRETVWRCSSWLFPGYVPVCFFCPASVSNLTSKQKGFDQLAPSLQDRFLLFWSVQPQRQNRSQDMISHKRPARQIIMAWACCQLVPCHSQQASKATKLLFKLKVSVQTYISLSNPCAFSQLRVNIWISQTGSLSLSVKVIGLMLTLVLLRCHQLTAWLFFFTIQLWTQQKKE